MKLILASASPRRKVLLKELFPDFEVRPADIEEVALPGETPLQSAERLAMEKALKVRETWKEGFILAADTLVTINGLVFGKPKDPIEAEEMLKTLMGKTHSVITAFCIIEAKSGKALVRSVESRVTIKISLKKKYRRISKAKSLSTRPGLTRCKKKAECSWKRSRALTLTSSGFPWMRFGRALKNSALYGKSIQRLKAMTAMPAMTPAMAICSCA